MQRAQAAKVFAPALPDSATNIWVAEYTHAQAYAQYLRFDAPRDVCLQYVDFLLAEQRDYFERLRGPFQIGPTQPITSANPPRLRLSGFKDGLAWFDAQNISNGIHRGGGPCIPDFWVDTDRGIFYYQCTD